MAEMYPRIGLVVCVLIVFAVAGVGSFFTRRGIRDWYPSLRKPSFNPPAWIFGPVWTVLYLSMAVAAWLVWRERSLQTVALPLTLFAVQLALNAAWTGIFFGLRRPGAAFVEICCLWALILLTLISFWRVSPLAGVLLIPYQLWVTFAAFLNLAIWRLNRWQSSSPADA